MARKLKVFQAHLGFYDTVVAVPSQPAALKAWGSRQNLFRDGLAKPADDPKAIAAATAKPGVVLRRPAGSKAPFSENPDLPQVPDAPKKPAALKKPESALRDRVTPKGSEPQARKPKPTPPDRSALDRAEKALEDLKREERDALAAIDKRKRRLAEEERKTRSDFAKRREHAQDVLERAAKAYRQAHGRR